MGKAANQLGTYSEISAIEGYDINGSYAANQCVKYQDIEPINKPSVNLIIQFKTSKQRQYRMRFTILSTSYAGTRRSNTDLQYISSTGAEVMVNPASSPTVTIPVDTYCLFHIGITIQPYISGGFIPSAIQFSGMTTNFRAVYSGTSGTSKNLTLDGETTTNNLSITGVCS